MKISARNVLKGKVSKVTKGAVSATVAIDIGEGVTVVSSVTLESVKDLKLKKGAEVYAVIKASDVMVGVAHDPK